MHKHPLDSESVCCHGQCNQGRSCPRYCVQKSTREVQTTVLVCALLLALLLLLSWVTR